MVTTFYVPCGFGGDDVFEQRLARELADRGRQVDVVDRADACSARSPQPAAGGRRLR